MRARLCVCVCVCACMAVHVYVFVGALVLMLGLVLLLVVVVVMGLWWLWVGSGWVGFLAKLCWVWLALLLAYFVGGCVVWSTGWLVGCLALALWVAGAMGGNVSWRVCVGGRCCTCVVGCLVRCQGSW